MSTIAGIAAFKQLVGRVDGADDALMVEILKQVSSRIDTYTGRLFQKAARTIKYNGGRRIYQLAAFPVDTLAALTVTVDSAAQTKGTDFYLWDAEGRIEFVYEVPVTFPQILSVTYTGGYAADTLDVLAVPDDLKRACLMQAAFEYRRRRDIGLKSVGMSGGNITVNDPVALLPEVKAVLDSYRVIAI